MARTDASSCTILIVLAIIVVGYIYFDNQQEQRPPAQEQRPLVQVQRPTPTPPPAVLVTRPSPKPAIRFTPQPAPSPLKRSIVATKNVLKTPVTAAKQLFSPKPAPKQGARGGGEEGFPIIGGSSVGAAVAAAAPSNMTQIPPMNASELLPNSTDNLLLNPSNGGIKGINFLSSPKQIVGVDTKGQSNRNANYGLRSEPPNPQVVVSPWLQSTIDPDGMRRPLEIGSGSM